MTAGAAKPIALHPVGKPGAVPALAEWVGQVDEWQGRRVIPLAHTSGLSTWLNSPENKALQAKAKNLLAAEFAAMICPQKLSGTVAR